MSPLNVDLAGHTSFQALTAVESMAAKALREWRTSGSESDVHRLSLVKDAVVFVRATLSRTDPALIATSTLGEIGKQATQLRGQLEPLAKGEGSAQHVSHAGTHADQLTQLIARIPAPPPVEGIDGLVEMVDSVRKSARGSLGGLRSAARKIEKRLDALETKSTELDTALTEQVKRVDSLVTEQQARFAESQEKRSQLASKFLEEQSARFTDTVQKLEEQIPTVRAAAESVNEKFQGRLHDLESQAEELLESLGVTSQSAAFLTSANREMKTARVWHGLAAGGLIGLVVVAVVYVAPILESADSMNWVSLAARTFIALTLAAAASYAGVQATKHSEREEYYRQMHLQLAALEPYLARLDEAERKRIKGELAQQFFRISYPGEHETERADLLDGILERLLKHFPGSGRS